MERILWLIILLKSFMGFSHESDCIFYKTVRDPTLIKSGLFGNFYNLENPSQNATKCTWVLSTSSSFVLNVLFINSTFQNKHLNSGCSENYVTVRQRRCGDGAVKSWQPYCGHEELPDIRINGTVEIELNYKKNSTDDKEKILMAIYAEASSKSCGGVYDGKAHGLSLQYDQAQFDFTPDNIAHCVWFLRFTTNKSVNVIPSKFKLAMRLNGDCRYYKEFFSIRRWSNESDNFVVDVEECSTIRSGLPTILNSSLGRRFALTIHSEYMYHYNEVAKMVYFPTSQGLAQQKTVNSYLQENYVFQSSNQLNSAPTEGLILVKSKQKTKDCINILIHDIASGCEGAIIEAWSVSADIFTKNRTIFVKGMRNSSIRLVAENPLLIYFKFNQSQETNRLQISYFTTNKICGGIFKIIPGQNISIKSPGDSNGYPGKADCRWAFVADSSTKLNISTKVMSLEPSGTCQFDFVNIYRGFRHNRTIVKKVCKLLQSEIVINGDCLVHFHSDRSQSSYPGFHIVIAATQDKNFTKQPTSTAVTRPCSKRGSTTQPAITTKTSHSTTRSTTRSTTPTKFSSKLHKKSTIMATSTQKSKSTKLNKQSRQKSSSSKMKTYLISTLAAVTALICAVSIAAIIIRRRRRSNLQSDTKTKPSGPNHERQRQNSTMPLVSMDELRKPSLPENSFDTVILENAHGETVFAEAENPYYASNSNTIDAKKEIRESANPYYMTSQDGMNQPVYDYADVVENVYAEPKKATQGEYSYTDISDSNKEADGKTQINFYEYASTNNRVENEYEI